MIYLFIYFLKKGWKSNINLTEIWGGENKLLQVSKLRSFLQDSADSRRIFV